MTTRVLVIGANGQDGMILYHHLKAMNFQVFGTYYSNLTNLKYFEDSKLYKLDVLRKKEVIDLIKITNPEIIINFAANSSVARSWAAPQETIEVDIKGTLNILDSIINYNPDIKYIGISSIDIYGQMRKKPFTEKSNISIRSPYGVGKSFVKDICGLYRVAHNLNVSVLILSNHESPLRPSSFLFKKIAEQVSQLIVNGKGKVYLQNPEVKRDWSWAPDIVNAMVRIITKFENQDFLLGSGSQCTVMEYVRNGMKFMGMDEEGIVITEKNKINRIMDITNSCADSRKFYSYTGWKTTKNLEQVFCEMVEFEIKKQRSKVPNNYMWDIKNNIIE
jgi:GDPmannose 4,6-dehydratase